MQRRDPDGVETTAIGRLVDIGGRTVLEVGCQPVSAEPPVEAGDGGLGRLDMREWRATIDAVDERTAAARPPVRVLQDVRLRILRARPLPDS